MTLLSLFGKHCWSTHAVSSEVGDARSLDEYLTFELITCGASLQLLERTASCQPNACNAAAVVKPDSQTLWKVMNCHPGIQRCSQCLPGTEVFGLQERGVSVVAGVKTLLLS